MARVAAETARARQELKGLDGSRVLGDLEKDADGAAKGLDRTTKSSDGLGRSTKSTSAEVDKFSGRLRLLADTAAIIGPAFVPIAAIAVPALAGMTAEFGAAALAGGTALLAFQGVGDTLKAVNTAALEPTTENLQAAREAMEQLSPAAQGFVTQLQAMQPLLKDLEGSAATGLFPGLGAALNQLTTAGPQVEQVLGSIGTVLGNLSKEGADALTGPGFSGFFEYVQREAPIALAQLGTAVGHVTHALAELVQAAAPLSADFGAGLLHAATAFDTFASGVSKTEGFQEFVAYIEQNGPHVGQAVESIANALLQVAEAASGFGGPVLQAVSATANVIAKLADSRFGPELVALAGSLALVNRAMAAQSAIQGSALFTQLGAAKTAAGAVEGFGGKILSVTKALGLWGLAVGVGAGILLHFAGNQQKAVTDTESLTSTLNQQTGAITQNTAAYVAKQFADNGVLDAAQKLGVSLSDVTDAALGNDAALGRVNERMAELKAQFDKPVAGRSVQDADKAADAYGKLADAGDTVTGAIGQTSSALTKGQGRLSQISQATKGAAGSFTQAATAAETFTAQIDHLNNTLSRRASLRDYQAAIDDFTKSLKTNGQTLDITSEKGRANQAALDNIASTAAKVAQSLHGADRADFLVNARKAFVDAAVDAGNTRVAAQKLADQIHLTGQASAKPSIGMDLTGFTSGAHAVSGQLATLNGSHAAPTITANASQALSAIGAVRTNLANLHDRDLFINVHTRNTGGSSTKTSAGGGTVPKSGQGYADRYHYLLADGEEVISNRHGQADRHRPLLKAINANRMAGGGTTGGSDPNWPKWLDLNTRQLQILSHELRSHPGIENRYSDSLIQGLKALDKTLNRQLKVQEKALTKAQTADDAAHTNLDNITGQRDSLSSTISGAFGLDNIFAKSPASTTPWAPGATGGGAIDPTSALNKITAAANQEATDIKSLRATGISDAALQAALAAGPDVIHQLAQGSAADLNAYSQAFGAATSAVSAVSSFGADSIFGQQLAAAQKYADREDQNLKDIKAEVKTLTAAVKVLDAANKDGHSKTADAAANSGTRAASNAQHRRKRGGGR